MVAVEAVGDEDPGAATVAVSPDGWRVASGTSEGVIRVWPMPDLDQRPLHLLPREELLAGLEARTNLRVVFDEESPRGRVEPSQRHPSWGVDPGQ